MTNEEAIRELRHLSSLLCEANYEAENLYGEPLYSKELSFTPVLFDVFEKSISALEKQAEIVHCNDCIHWKSIEVYPNVRVCEFAGYLVGENGYCVYGEVKE